eukprot:scaffold656_cov403-Pavlova_lutheri.AAC.18
MFWACSQNDDLDDTKKIDTVLFDKEMSFQSPPTCNPSSTRLCPLKNGKISFTWQTVDLTYNTHAPNSYE